MLIKKSIKRYIVVSYVVIGMILLLIFAGIVANVIFKNGKERVRQNIIENNENVYQSTNIILDSLYNYMYNQYMKDELIVDALYSKDISYFKKYKIQDKIDDILKSSPILDSIYVYNCQLNLVFSNISVPKSPENFYESDIVSKILTHRKETGSKFYARNVELTNISLSNTSKNLISFVLSDSKEFNISSMIVINISQELLQELIHQSNSNNQMQTLIIDNNGTLITNLSSRDININLHDKEYINKIITDTQTSGTFNTKIDGKDHFVSYKRSSRWGSIFVSIGSYEELLFGINKMMQIIGALTLIFILLSISGVFYFTRIIYSPINKMVNEVYSLGHFLSDKYTNEYDFVFSSIETMKNQIDKLNSKVDRFSPANKNRVLKQILNGNKVEQASILNNNINLPGPEYVVVVLRFDSFAKISDNKSIKDIVMYKNDLLKMAKKVLHGYNYEIVDDGLEYITVILNAADKCYTQKLKETIWNMQREFNELHEFTFTAGVGSSVNKLVDIKYAFREAVDATDYRIVYGINSIIFGDDVLSNDKKEYVYPLHLEKKIIDNLKLRKKHKLEVLMQEFTNEVREFEYNEILLSFSQLTLMIVRTAKQIKKSLLKSLRINFIDMQKKLKNYDTIEEINDAIKSIMFDIIDKQDQNVNIKSVEIINRVKLFVEQKYSDDTLTVESIACNEHLSTNYLRNLFKSIEGISLSDYINKKRFDEAKRLLLETNYSAKKIACLTGFQNTNYFYYAFKKYIGMSPTNFRQINNNSINS